MLNNSSPLKKRKLHSVQVFYAVPHTVSFTDSTTVIVYVSC